MPTSSGVSNFDSSGPVKVGERAGLGPWGTLDMAGNVKEWCANGRNDESMRYILGGGWNEPNYRYTEADARSPWERAPTFGVRLMKDREERPAGAIDDTTAPIAQVYGDPKSVVPVSDALFEVYRRFYTYDRSPLAAKTEAVDDTPPYWRVETVSFAAAYGGERVPARLFLPKNAHAALSDGRALPERVCGQRWFEQPARPRALRLHHPQRARAALPRLPGHVRAATARRPPFRTPGATCRCSRRRISFAPSTISRRVRTST